MPPFVLTSSLSLTDDAVAEIRARWHQRYAGWRNWLEPAVLDKDARVQPISWSLSEMGFEGLDARSEARICQVLRVPPILVGAKVGLDRSTFANYSEARRSFWEDSLMPQYRRIRDELQVDLIDREFGDEHRLDWDFSDVPALQEDRTARWQRATESLSAGGITVNDFRREVGLDAIGPAGDVFLRGFNVTEVPARTVTGVKALLPASPLSNNVGGNGHKRVDDRRPPDDESRRRHERQMERELTAFFAEQIERVRERLREDVHAA